MAEERARPGLTFRAVRRLGGEVDAVLDWIQGRLKSHPQDLLMRVFALRRSGHHALLNWIRYQLPCRHWLLNDCRLGENPLQSALFMSSAIQGRWHEHRVFHLAPELAGRHAYKGALIYNFEESDLRRVPRLMPVAAEAEWLGTAARRMDLLILRDPFNLLASKLKWAYGDVERPSKPSLDEVAQARQLWKVHAREFLGETTHLTDRITVSYNDWFLDRAYRDQKAAEIGFRNEDKGLSKVARWGPTLSADSFDGLRFDGRAQDMKVLERWWRFIDDPFFRELVADPELHRLSSRIFGEMAGVNELR